MNKKELSERDICTKFITPAITAGGKWDLLNQIREEVYFTNGRVIVRGQLSTRAEPKRADYVLSYKPGIRLAIVEAKDNNHNHLTTAPTPDAFRNHAAFFQKQFTELTFNPKAVTALRRATLSSPFKDISPTKSNRAPSKTATG